MSGYDKVAEVAARNGWFRLKGGDFFRWDGGTRVEVHVVCDAAGRIEAVSEWRNTRVSIQDQPGARAEAERLLRQPSVPGGNE